jgi:hypothetical protein
MLSYKETAAALAELPDGEELLARRIAEVSRSPLQDLIDGICDAEGIPPDLRPVVHAAPGGMGGRSESPGAWQNGRA